jgi:hypothetical protein
MRRQSRHPRFVTRWGARSLLAAAILVAAVALLGAGPAWPSPAWAQQPTDTTAVSAPPLAAATAPAAVIATATPVPPSAAATATGAPAAPVAAPPPRTGTTAGPNEDVFRVNGNIVIGPGETAKSVVALNGRVTVQGHVLGDVFAANGDIDIPTGGRVDGDAVTLNGHVIRQGTGSVGGDVVDMALNNVDVGGFHPSFPALSIFGWFFITLGALGLGVLLALVANRQLDTVGEEFTDRLGRTVLVGFASLIGVPVVFIVLLLSVVGIPIAVLLLPVVFVMGLFGVFAGCLVVGRRLLVAFGRPYAGDLWAMVIGILLLRVILIVPVLDWFIYFIVSTVGFGAILSRLWDVYSVRRAARATRPLPPTPPAAPVPVGTEVAQPATGAPATQTQPATEEATETIAPPAPAEPAELPAPAPDAESEPPSSSGQPEPPGPRYHI